MKERLVGVFDAVIQNEDDTYTILEHKTAARRYSRTKLDHDLQITRTPRKPITPLKAGPAVAALSGNAGGRASAATGEVQTASRRSRWRRLRHRPGMGIQVSSWRS